MKVQLRKKNETELLIEGAYDERWVARVRQMAFRRWDVEARGWVIPYTDASIRQLLQFEGILLVIDEALLEENELLLDYALKYMPVRLEKIELEQSRWEPRVRRQLMLRLRLKGYSPTTLRTYVSHVERFYRYYEGHREVPVHDLLTLYCEKLIGEKRSHTYVNQAISALKLFFEQVCGLTAEQYTYIRPRKKRILPNVLSMSEVKRLLDSVRNVKHRAILLLTYSSGLRVSEVVRLKLSDLDADRRTVRVRQGKGRKDRLTLLSEHAYAAVQCYVNQYKPEKWLFPGQDPGSPISERSVQKMFEKALAEAGIRKEVSLHSLRHSFATHLLEGGIDIRYIQELLGHRNVQTTEIYTHVATKHMRNIKSPLDSMMD